MSDKEDLPNELSTKYGNTDELNNFVKMESTEKKHKKKKKTEINGSIENKDSDTTEIDDIKEPMRNKPKKKKRNEISVISEHTDYINTKLDDVNENNIEQPTDKKIKKKKRKESGDILESTDCIPMNLDGINENDIENPVEKKHKKKKRKEISVNIENIDDSPTKLDDINEKSIDEPAKKKHKMKKSEHPNFISNKLDINVKKSAQTAKTGTHKTHINKQISFTQNYSNGEEEFMNSEFSECIFSNKDGRNYTISIAIPASILESTCRSDALRTYIVGQISRAACIYSIDEIIIFNDFCWGYKTPESEIEEYIGMMKMILEYQECPQYLRKNFFPYHPYMQNAGLLNALNAPHHLLSHQWCPYREGVVLEKGTKSSSYVHAGLKNEVHIDKKLKPGLRVTINFPPETKSMKKLYGSVVSPEEPRKTGGFYWGYTVRAAFSLSEVFKSDRFPEYDLVIGTSDKGEDAAKKKFDEFSHALIVFGGVEGLEAAVKGDNSLKDNLETLFPHYVNVCPDQTSRTIRTEEAVLITLSVMCPKLKKKGKNTP